ncbi:MULTISPECIES: hypothetical protein [unclassified Streptomyces]|uniref:hypothetical protein n=1 Tax=unclassified Streptomyces TaxID=2593676 RepID=UPI00226F3F04|nr:MULTISPECIES: hypothetical protein [unclassified Streptomyces]MCY0921868.1 hypothetical protein [Streptomyces sp. H27-G5]MCY0957182.1 hypothetical protein [Streptomyces sp. H27-H5]
MHDQEQPEPARGSVPLDFRNALFWRWTRDLPRPLRGGFLKVLYALGTAANSRGEMRFRDGKEIRIQDIAKGAATDEKDCRRYINAAIAAGVVGVAGARGRGKPTVYQLLVSPRPDWTAAVASLAESLPVKKKPPKPAPWQDDPEFGGPPPEPDAQSSGDHPPNFPEQSSGDRPPLGFGGPSPVEFGGPSPEQPRVTQVLPQESAAVVDQLSPGGPSPGEDGPADADPPPGAWPPRLTLTTQQRRDARAAEAKAKSAGNKGQMPLLLSVRDPEHVATVAEVRAAAEGHPEIVLRAIRDLGVRGAVTLYGHRLVHPHLTDESEPDTDTRPA